MRHASSDSTYSSPLQMQDNTQPCSDDKPGISMSSSAETVTCTRARTHATEPFCIFFFFFVVYTCASLSTSASLLYNPTVFISFFTGVACPCLAHSYATSRRVLSVARSELEFWWIEISNSRCRLPIEFRYVARRVPGIRARARERSTYGFPDCFLIWMASRRLIFIKAGYTSEGAIDC